MIRLTARERGILAEVLRRAAERPGDWLTPRDLFPGGDAQSDADRLIVERLGSLGQLARGGLEIGTRDGYRVFRRPPAVLPMVDRQGRVRRHG